MSTRTYSGYINDSIYNARSIGNRRESTWPCVRPDFRVLCHFDRREYALLFVGSFSDLKNSYIHYYISILEIIHSTNSPYNVLLSRRT